MASDERNFRSTYYEKVGFRSVEEKKSLEILLKDKHLDRGKLKQFCLRYSVPLSYRNLVWKLLLGVIPVHVECHNFVMDQRKQEYDELFRTLNVMKIVDTTTSKPLLILAMYYLQTGNFTYDFFSESHIGFTSIAKSFTQFFDDDIDIYWLAKSFYQTVCKFEGDIPKLVDCSCNLLEREDPLLFRHLMKTEILDNLPLTEWFDCCFAGILHDAALGKIWDKVCGGSYKILVYVVVVLLTNLNHRLLKCNSLVSCMQCIKNISEETADIIANKSIDMWQQHGSPLTINDKPAKP